MKVKYATSIVNNMEESLKFYTEILNFKIKEEFIIPDGKITLLKGNSDCEIELIEDSNFQTGLYSIGLDVDDINHEIKVLKDKGANIAMMPTKISVGLMARITDPNGINIVLIQHM